MVSLPGEVSHYNAPQVHEELMAALEPGVTTVILDLTLTTFFDSAGLGKIAIARRLATAYHIDLRLVVPASSPLGRLLRVERLRPGAGDLPHPAGGAHRAACFGRGRALGVIASGPTPW